MEAPQLHLNGQSHVVPSLGGNLAMDLVLTHNSLAVSAPGGQRSQARVTSWTSLEIQLSSLQERHQFAAGAKSLQSCPTLCDPIRRQPTRLPRPWDSPGKNTGVGCHFLLQCMKVKSESEVTQSCPTLHDPMTAPFQAPLPMGFSRQEYWSGVPLPSPA